MSLNTEEDDNKTQKEMFRFIQDLEFVQCLVNPNYLKYLSDKGYLDDDIFINYLKYLLYFKKIEYMKYITFERCLLFLELLQYKEFREQLKQNNYAQINTVNGIMSLTYTQCLDDFIMNDWRARTNKEINQIENKNEDNNNNKEFQNNENKINKENQGMDIEN